MSTPAAPVTAAPVAAAPKVSWLKKFGHDIGVALGFVAKEAQPIAAAAGTVATALMPQFAPEISTAENLVSKIALQATTTEAAFSAVGQGSNGPAKLQAVLSSVGPEIQTWVQNSFPGAAKVSEASQAGLVNAVVAILNDVDGNLALTVPSPSSPAVAAAAATVAAVKAVTGTTPVAS
jgi:hypothetical protein